MKFGFFLLVAFLLFSLTGLMAQDCQYELNEFDKFTKEQKLLTKSKLLWKNAGTGNTFTFKASLDKGHKSLQIKYSDPKSFTLLHGGDLMLLLANGEAITLHFDQEIAAKRDVVEPRYTALFSCPLDEEIIARLMSQTITDFRIVHSTGHFDHPVSAEYAKNIPVLLNCLK